MEITNEQINKAFENLSDEWQEAILDVGVDKKINEITEKYKLQLDSANTVYMETNYVILGLKKAEDFRAELAKDQKIPLQIIDSLVTDVNEQVLEAIRMKIIENKEIDEAFEEIEPEAPVDVATIENKVAAIPTPTSENLTQTGGFVFNEAKPEAVQVPVAQPTEIPATIVPPPALEMHEENILKDSGIDMHSLPIQDLVQSKLTGAFSMGKEATDHTLPSINKGPTVTPPKSAGDPYREAV
jgi:restriction endonuclease